MRICKRLRYCMLPLIGLMAFAAGAEVSMNSTRITVPDETPHLIFNVTDMVGTVAAIKAAGGRMDQEPFEFGDTGIMIGMGIGPVGNHFDLLYFPSVE